MIGLMRSKPDISHLKFTSRVFPTPEDMALWNSLSPAEQQAVITRDIELGLASPAITATRSDLMQRARSRTQRNAG